MPSRPIADVSDSGESRSIAAAADPPQGSPPSYQSSFSLPEQGATNLDASPLVCRDWLAAHWD
jgi:hypothetical protein